MTLIDPHQRRVRKLRLSLTDKCNLRCHYCMPVDQTFMEEAKYLSPDAYEEIVAELVDHGLEELRLTGGEPLLRKSFPEIVRKLSALKLKKIGLTTNGILLDQHFDLLLAHKIYSLNVSLDSLDEGIFKKITRGSHFHRVVENIVAAKKLGFLVKVNAVIMKGVNDHELMDFVKFAEDHQVEVRFLELMRIGHARETQEDQFLAAAAMKKRLEWHYTFKSLVADADSTSQNFVTNTGALIGFIASESQPFCGQCSRWRLSADGTMRACLLKDDGLSLRHLTADERLEAYQKLLGMKPTLRPIEVFHSMNLIGG